MRSTAKNRHLNELVFVSLVLFPSCLIAGGKYDFQNTDVPDWSAISNWHVRSGVTFFLDPGYGTQPDFPGKLHDPNEYGSGSAPSFVQNDAVSSFSVEGNTSVEVCQDTGGQGVCQTFTSSQASLPTVLDNQISYANVVSLGPSIAPEFAPGLRIANTSGAPLVNINGTTGFPTGEKELEHESYVNIGTSTTDSDGNLVLNSARIDSSTFSLNAMNIASRNSQYGSHLVLAGGQLWVSPSQGDYGVGNCLGCGGLSLPSNGAGYLYVTGGRTGILDHSSFHMAGGPLGKVHQMGGSVEMIGHFGGGGTNTKIGHQGLGIYEIDAGDFRVEALTIGLQSGVNGIGVLEQHGGIVEMQESSAKVSHGWIKMTGGSLLGNIVTQASAQQLTLGGSGMQTMFLMEEASPAANLDVLSGLAGSYVNIAAGELKVRDFDTVGSTALGGGKLKFAGASPLYSGVLSADSNSKIEFPAGTTTNMHLKGVSSFSGADLFITNGTQPILTMDSNALLIVDSISTLPFAPHAYGSQIRERGSRIEFDYEVHGGAIISDDLRLSAGGKLITPRNERSIATGLITEIRSGAEIDGQFVLGQSGSSNFVFINGNANFSGISDVSGATIFGTNHVSVDTNESILFVSASSSLSGSDIHAVDAPLELEKRISGFGDIPVRVNVNVGGGLVSTHPSGIHLTNGVHWTTASTDLDLGFRGKITVQANQTASEISPTGPAAIRGLGSIEVENGGELLLGTAEFQTRHQLSNDGRIVLDGLVQMRGAIFEQSQNGELVVDILDHSSAFIAEDAIYVDKANIGGKLTLNVSNFEFQSNLGKERYDVLIAETTFGSSEFRFAEIELVGNGVNPGLQFTGAAPESLTWALAVTYDALATFEDGEQCDSPENQTLLSHLRTCNNPVYVTAHVALPGDANLDGSVNALDLNLTYINSSNGLTDANWVDGDFDGNGIVNNGDVNVVIENWQRTWPASSASVPEPPSSTTLLIGAFVAISEIRRRMTRNV